MLFHPGKIRGKLTTTLQTCHSQRMEGACNSPKNPFFAHARIDNHNASSGKRQNSKQHLLPTGLHKAIAFLENEHLHDIQTAHDQSFFYDCAKCFHSFKARKDPHNLKLVLCSSSREVKCGFKHDFHCNFYIQDFLTSLNPLTTYNCEFNSFAIDQREVNEEQVRDYLQELVRFLQNRLMVVDQVSRVSRSYSDFSIVEHPRHAIDK